VKISVKGRYGLAVMISMAQNYESKEHITVMSLAGKLGFSKIYLEQVFSLIKRAGLVTSIKGAQGGYQLAKEPKLITVYDILSAIESSIFEKADETVTEKANNIEQAMQKSAFDMLDNAVEKTLKSITLSNLVNEAEIYKSQDGFMFFI